MVKYLEALFLLKRYQDWPENDPQETSFHSNLGSIYFAEGRYLAAKQLVSRVEKVLRNKGIVCREPHLLSLAVLMKHECNSHSIESQEDIFSILNEHILLDAIAADVLNNLGACSEVRGELEDAHRSYSESLCLRQVRRSNTLKNIEDPIH